ARYRALAVPVDVSALPLRLHARLPGRDVCTHTTEPGRAFVTPLGELLAARIEREGPIGFLEFMAEALYHPTYGYYRRARDPFGRDGDFYTAEQIQPVFGILVAQQIRSLARAMGDSADFTVVELGAGRGAMAEAFREWTYIPVEYGQALPKGIR